MFDLAWSEILIIGVVALVVIGPKELPRVLRSIGQWVRRARQLASEFQAGIDQMAREADVADLRKQVEQAGDFAKGNITPEVLIDSDGEIRKALDLNAAETPAPTAEVPAELMAPAEPVAPAVAAEPEAPAAPVPVLAKTEDVRRD